MSKPPPSAIAQRLEAVLRGALRHDQVRVRSNGAHLNIDVLHADTPERVARLTHLADGVYSAAYRNQAGRWEPMPIEGALEEAGDQIAKMLHPYLTPI